MGRVTFRWSPPWTGKLLRSVRAISRERPLTQALLTFGLSPQFPYDYLTLNLIELRLVYHLSQVRNKNPTTSHLPSLRLCEIRIYGERVLPIRSHVVNIRELPSLHGVSH